MDLRTFVSETLCQIQGGVKDAIERQAGDPRENGAINPHFSRHAEDLRAIVRMVQFDVAVTVSTAAEGEARGGLQVLGLDIGGKGTLSRENSAVSRIQFDVPIVPPTMNIDQDATRESNARIANLPRSYK